MFLMKSWNPSLTSWARIQQSQNTGAHYKLALSYPESFEIEPTTIFSLRSPSYSDHILPHPISSLVYGGFENSFILE